MKRGIIVFSAIISLCLITGCGKSKNQVVCTGKATEDGQTYEAKIVANLKDGKVKDGTIEMKFSDKESAEQMCSLMSLANSMAEDEKDKIDYSCKGKTIKFNSLAMFDDEDSVIGLTKDEFIKTVTADSDEIKCK